MPHGTHVVYSNGYFTFIDNKGIRDVKVSVLPRWCTAMCMGATNMRNTVSLAHNGDDGFAIARAMLEANRATFRHLYDTGAAWQPNHP